MHERPVRELMTPDPLVVAPETPFLEVVRALLGRGIDAAPVVDGGRLVGVVSTSDLTAHEEEPASLARTLLGGRSSREHARKCRGRTAQELMTSPAVTVEPGATVAEALRTMSRAHVGRVVVVEGGRVVGVLTRSDVLRVFLRDEAALRADVDAALARIACEHDVDVSLVDGVVRLDGWVELASCGWAATSAVAQVPGVVDVDDRLSYRVDDAMVEQLALRGTLV